MPTKPENDPPQWAHDDITDPVSGLPNVVEPTAAKKAAGWNRAEKPARQFQNWFMRGAGAWLVYLAERDGSLPVTVIQDGTGVNVLPVLPWGEGDNPIVAAFCLFVAVNLSTGDQVFGGALGDADGFENAFPIVADGLGLGTPAGRNLPITGAAANDIELIVITHPVRLGDVLNAE